MSEELKLIIDIDKITVDAFLELVELQEEMANGVGGSALRKMVNLLKPAITNVDMGSLPYSKLKPTIEQIMAVLSGSIDPN